MEEKQAPVSYYCTQQFLDSFLGNFQVSDRPKRMAYRYMDEERKSPSPTRTSPLRRTGQEVFKFSQPRRDYYTDLEASERRKKGDKYSHIQAKVQCFRTKGEKSPTRMS